MAQQLRSNMDEQRLSWKVDPTVYSPGPHKLKLSTDLDLKDMRSKNVSSKIKLSKDSLIAPEFVWEINMPDFFVGFKGYWVSFEITLDGVASSTFVKTQGGWSLVVEANTVLDGLEKRANFMDFSDRTAAIRSAFFGIMRAWSPKMKLRVSLAQSFIELADPALTTMAWVANLAIDFVSATGAVDVARPQWGVEEDEGCGGR